MTGVNTIQRMGAGRWRCGVCLFELADHIAPDRNDLPYQNSLPPEHVSGRGQSRPIIGDRLKESTSRGCETCILISHCVYRPPSPFHAVWQQGEIHSYINPASLQIFVLKFSEASLSLNPFITIGDVPTGDTGSEAALKKAAEWILQSSQEHQVCNKAVAEARRMPERLLYIEHMASFNIRLVEDADMLPPESYVCLSHRWMPETTAVGLTAERAETFRKQIPRSTLYPLLSDALEVTYRLGLRYIWIDCLCIYQHDLGDWHSQAAEMAAIYENAFLTISALSCGPGPNADKRLFSRRHPDKPLRSLRSKEGTVCFFREIHNHAHPFWVSPADNKSGTMKSLPEFSLTQRGWAYQARILSRRILHFSRRELIWDCQEALLCECRYREHNWRKAKLATPDISHIPRTEIVCEYSKTSLSKSSDKLPALSGIAKRVGEARGWNYLAGLWVECLKEQLTWGVRCDQAEIRPRLRQLPSWSWASVNGQLEFWDSSNSHIEIISHGVVNGPNPYGIPKSTQLVISGPCVPATLASIVKPS